MNESLQANCKKLETDDLIINCYNEYLPYIINFVSYRINKPCDVEDIAQDAFVRLLDFKQLLRPETIRSFIFTITRNLVIDYLRKQYRRQEVSANLLEFYEDKSATIETNLYVRDLSRQEEKCLNLMPAQRKLVYTLNRFEDKTALEISEELLISKRTVECHLYQSRKEIRTYLKDCI